MVRKMNHIHKKIVLVILLLSVWYAVHLGFQSISSHFDLRHSTIPMGFHSSSSGFNLRTGIQWPGPPYNQAMLSEWSEFLSQNLTETPFDTDKLAGRMRTNDEVVWGTQQLLLNVLRSLVGGRRHAMLMEIETHENKGDSAITLGDLTLLRHLNISIVFYCDVFNCTNSTLSLARNISSQYSPDSLVIFMQGGGNLVGYEVSDLVRSRVLKVFPDFPVILLSQSIWIHQNNLKHLNECRQIYSNQANLTIFLRDRQSLALAQKYFMGTRLILMPDLAFCIGRVPRFMPPLYDILWIKRGDNESSQYKMPPIPNEISVHVADWLDWKSNKGLTPLETSVHIAVNGLVFLQRGRVVVTDRLHGHILSVLSGIPHVLIDNPPFLKLSSFHRTWTSGLENVVIVNDSEDALKQARGFLQKYGDDLPPVILK